jgi:hypothetical protein
VHLNATGHIGRCNEEFFEGSLLSSCQIKATYDLSGFFVTRWDTIGEQQLPGALLRIVPTKQKPL